MSARKTLASLAFLVVGAAALALAVFGGYVVYLTARSLTLSDFLAGAGILAGGLTLGCAVGLLVTWALRQWVREEGE